MPANEDRPDADNVEATNNKASNPEVNHAVGWTLERLLKAANSGMYLWPLTFSAMKNGQPEYKKPLTVPGTSDRVEASNDPEQLTAWFAKHSDHWGYDPAKSKLVAFDVDHKPDGANGFETVEAWENEAQDDFYTRATWKLPTRHGFHVLYRAPDDKTLAKPLTDLKDGIDYVGANNARLHPSPELFAWIDAGCPVEPLPLPIARAVRDRLQRSASAAAGGELLGTDDILKGVPEGKRDNTLFKAACRWRRQLGDNRKAVETLALAAARACQPPFPDDQAIKCVDSAFRQDHRDDDDVATEWARLTVADEEEVTTDPTWAPVNLRDIIDGTRRAVSPTLFRRDDDRCLVYPGKTHSFHGESESGKSMVVQWLAVQSLVTGDAVLYLDFESDEVEVVSRLLMLGAPPQAIIDLFVYVRPEANPYKVADERDAWLALLGRPYTLAVIDGVTNALGVFGYKSKENDDLSNWSRVFPDPLARRTGAAVVMVDHVTKSTDGRGRFAIGGQQKMSALSGAGYTVEVAEPLGKGMRGEVVLRVGKDRPGQVRPFSGPFRKTDRTQEAARVIFDSTAEEMTVTVEAPNLEPPATPDEIKVQKVYVLVNGIRQALKDNPDGLSSNGLKDALRAAKVPVPNDGSLPQALAAMEERGELERAKRPGRGGGELWRLKNEPIPNWS